MKKTCSGTMLMHCEICKCYKKCWIDRVETGVYDAEYNEEQIDIHKIALVKDAKVSYCFSKYSSMVRKIMDNEIVPAHAPSWAKMDDDQWINKLIHMAEHPNKYQNSLLKETLLKACETYR